VLSSKADSPRNRAATQLRTALGLANASRRKTLHDCTPRVLECASYDRVPSLPSHLLSSYGLDPSRRLTSLQHKERLDASNLNQGLFERVTRRYSFLQDKQHT
jgi:hypothetical protein